MIAVEEPAIAQCANELTDNQMAWFVERLVSGDFKPCGRMESTQSGTGYLYKPMDACAGVSVWAIKNNTYVVQYFCHQHAIKRVSSYHHGKDRITLIPTGESVKENVKSIASIRREMGRIFKRWA